MFGWLVALHLVGFAIFLIAHGVSMWVAFRIRREPNRDVVAALLGLSSRGSQVMYLGFLLLGIGGLGRPRSGGLADGAVGRRLIRRDRRRDPAHVHGRRRLLLPAARRARRHREDAPPRRRRARRPPRQPAARDARR